MNNDTMIKEIQKIFPNFNVEIYNNFGIINCIIKYKNFDISVYTDVIGKNDYEILLELIDLLIFEFHKYLININEIDKIKELLREVR